MSDDLTSCPMPDSNPTLSREQIEEFLNDPRNITQEASVTLCHMALTYLDHKTGWEHIARTVDTLKHAAESDQRIRASLAVSSREAVLGEAWTAVDDMNVSIPVQVDAEDPAYGSAYVHGYEDAIDRALTLIDGLFGKGAQVDDASIITGEKK